VQEEETNIIDQAVEPAAEATTDNEDREAAGSEDKPTRTLKLNRSAASATEESSAADGEEPAVAADGDTAQANEEGEHQGARADPEYRPYALVQVERQAPVYRPAPY